MMYDAPLMLPSPACDLHHILPNPCSAVGEAVGMQSRCVNNKKSA